MRRIIALIAALLVVLSLASCGVAKKTLHCDHCGKEVEVREDSNMEEDWILYCEQCAEELGLDDLVSPG